MGKNPAQLNQKQIEVLRWVRDGCPAGTYGDGYEHRIIARALERRGLVSINGRGPTWSAAITDKGIKWQDAPPAEILPGETEVDQLIAQVITAEGRLVLPDDRESEKTHERLVRMSLKSPVRPRGKKLEMISTGQWGHGPKAVILAEHFDDLVEPVPVAIPEHFARHHPAVRAFMKDKEWQYVTADHVPRAARILQAIATEAGKRKIDALIPADAMKGLTEYQQREVRKGHLALRTPAGVYGIQIKELPGPGGRKVDPRPWNARKTQAAWIERRGWEFISTGRLELVVHGPGSGYNGDQYRDAKSSTVEDKLPEVFRAFEIHKLRFDWQEQERQRKEAERHRRWEAAMAEAKVQYHEYAKWEHFKSRSKEWQAANQHRLFLETARRALESYDGDDRDLVHEQLNQAERTLNDIDPIADLSGIVPDVPDPKPDDLKPFLNGWSPYGPDRQSR